MNSTEIIIVIAVVLVVALAYGAYRILGSRQQLHERFGDEYDRVVADKGSRAAGESELRRRVSEHKSLGLRDVTDEDRKRYREGWMAVQKQFVDDPAAAVRNAEQLVSTFVTDRGYPDADFDDRVAQLSVAHANTLNDYRVAHEISVSNDAGRATTEELRQALVHYRDLLAQLVADDLGAATDDTSLRKETVPDARPPAKN